MTDEEMAVEYAEKQNLQNINPSGIVRYELAEAFLVGLKVGRPKWHDLRKDPKDLPKENELYLVFGYTNKREKFYELDVFDPTEEEFLGCGENVYAWCEIPKYMEV